MVNITTDLRKVFSTLGASSHSTTEREPNDFYATNPKAMELLLEVENFYPKIWECACGQGHLSKVLEAHGYDVLSTDLINRGYGLETSVDFLHNGQADDTVDMDIITNPPYSVATEFVKEALRVIKPGRKVAMFLRLQFLEGVKRRRLFNNAPPQTVYVCSSRIECVKNAEFDKQRYKSAVAYAWFVWEKGFNGVTEVRWIN